MTVVPCDGDSIVLWTRAPHAVNRAKGAGVRDLAERHVQIVDHLTVQAVDPIEAQAIVCVSEILGIEIVSPGSCASLRRICVPSVVH